MNGHQRVLSATRRRGFTMIDATLATAIIGTAVVSLMALLGAGTRTSIDASQQTQATALIRNIREMCVAKRFSDLPAMHNRTYAPPVDSRGRAISVLSNWRQVISVQSVNPDRLTTDLIDSDPDAVRVSVSVFQNNRQIAASSWYSFRVDP